MTVNDFIGFCFFFFPRQANILTEASTNETPVHALSELVNDYTEAYYHDTYLIILL